jgi:hypothetical protein
METMEYLKNRESQPSSRAKTVHQPSAHGLAYRVGYSESDA